MLSSQEPASDSLLTQLNSIHILFQATPLFFCRIRLCLTSLRAEISHLTHVCYMFHASHFPGFISLIILVKVVYELRILLRNLSLH